MKLLSTTKVTQQSVVGKQGLSTASRCTIVDCYLERRRRSRQDSEWVPPEHRDVGCITDSIRSTRCVYCTQLTTNTWVSHKVTGRMRFSFVMQGVLFQRPGLLHAREVWVIMREEFCYCTVSDNTTLFPNHILQILSG
jgi:hypothetical protein